MTDQDDAKRAQNFIVALVIIVGLIGFGLLYAFAESQQDEPVENCLYDPRDGSKTCQSF